MQQNNLNLALCQWDIKWENVELNLSMLNDAVQVFFNSAPKTDILILPEFFSTGFTMNNAAAQEPNGPSTLWLRSIAAKFDVAVVASIPIREGEKLYNRCFFITPEGDECHYNKRHLFNMAGEGEVYTRGEKQVVVDYKGWRIALNICYDLRFPVWSRNCDNKYDLMINVANWPSSRIEAAKVLSRARAIENCSYFAFCNRVGSDLECEYNGASAVIDFKGFDIASIEICNNTDFICATLEMDKLLAYRDKFPSWRDSDMFTIQ